MADTFKYLCKVMATNGTVAEKIIDADSVSSAERIIRQASETPISISEYRESGSKDVADLVLFEKKVKAKDLALFCRQLHTMLYAGMPLIKALGVMSEQIEHPTLKRVSKDMMEDVQKGRVFSEAMKKHKKYFPPLLINMVESGEMTGKQDEVLYKMSIHFEKEDRVENKIKSALVYPKFLSVLTFAVVVIMLTFVLPMFSKVYSDGNAELPALTQFVMGISDFMVSKWFILVAIIVLLVFAFKAFLATKGGKRAWDGFILKIPIVNRSIRKVITSRFTRTLSTLLSSGVPLLSSLDMAGKVTGNSLVEEKIDGITEDIKKGSKLSSLIKKVDVFPPMLISMVSIGEESGALEDMLERTSDFYDEELETALTKLVGLVEPVMILVMGVIIGFIVMSMLMPMFSLFQAFQNR